ncbi:hypothetical protein EC968_004697 [Mortierella alpina]|nr:hypothetical protein EC968_004697 [Mortierella alpina]
MAATPAPVAGSKDIRVAAKAGTRSIIIVDSFTADLIRSARVAMAEHTGPLKIYCDGSLKLIDGKPSCTFSSVYLSKKKEEWYDCAVLGKTATDHSSYVAELVGLLASIMACPRKRPATIHTDNQGIANAFDPLVVNRGESLKNPQRVFRRARFPHWWELVYKAYLQQGRMITVKWVKGHSGIPGNEAADHLANYAHKVDYDPWRIWKPTLQL